MGRGGRIALDRCGTNIDDIWSSLDYKIFDSERDKKPSAKNHLETQTNQTNVDLCPAALPNSTQLHQLTAGRVSNVRLSSATSDGTSSPLSYFGGLSSLRGVNSVNVITSEQPISDVVTVKEEQLDDYERLIDNVRNNKSESNANSTGTSNKELAGVIHSSNQSSNININPLYSNTPISAQGSFTSELFDYTVKTENRLSTDLLDATVEYVKSEALITDPVSVDPSESIYDEFLNEIDQSWLHFRPKTPTTSSNSNDADCSNYNDFVEQDSIFRIIETVPFNVELQTLSAQLPHNLFADNESMFITTEPLTMDTFLIGDLMINKTVYQELCTGKLILIFKDSYL